MRDVHRGLGFGRGVIVCVGAPIGQCRVVVLVKPVTVQPIGHRSADLIAQIAQARTQCLEFPGRQSHGLSFPPLSRVRGAIDAALMLVNGISRLYTLATGLQSDKV
jgi:hypothetical protein